ncbi:ExbD/TolR family protein [Flavobacterium silvaticum]|uniref:Biopolymer transporter ExbD n=1 Tax=Flavobacterium silvaticum TaxID=1852020 RepID=A0A972FL65_9FLAO|nr:biopolymer transporter ExbD [Flavobacterium silvaticum]NMH27265.1 biopolymer transporter ExbD [Flavobacterium silvaticum]
MAELNTGGGEGKKGSKKVRSKKLNSKVDLTAMVDLAFLLITFFMLTTSLSKPQSMDLSLPNKEDDPLKEKPQKVDENRTMTLLLGENNKLMYYMGIINQPMAPKEIAYGKAGLRPEILKQKQKVTEYTRDPKKGLIVIIKPSKKSKYRNVVDALDEMGIDDVPTYAITDITDEEAKLLDGSTGTETPSK